MQAKLTKRTVDAAGPAYVMCSSGTRATMRPSSGFGLKVTPMGRKVFLFQYWSPVQRGARRRMTLGTHGPVTVDGARRIARQLAGRVAAGEDPAQAKSDARVAARDATVERLAQAYMDEIQPKKAPHDRVVRVAAAPAHPPRRSGPAGRARAASRCRSAAHGAGIDADDGEPRRRAAVGADALVRAPGLPPARQQSGGGRRLVPRSTRGERFLTVGEIAQLGAALTAAERDGLPTAPSLKRSPRSKRDREAHADVARADPGEPVRGGGDSFLLLSGWREQEP
jgi:hypothetical protein